jgi:hypothetical protein
MSESITGYTPEQTPENAAAEMAYHIRQSAINAEKRAAALRLINDQAEAALAAKHAPPAPKRKRAAKKKA